MPKKKKEVRCPVCGEKPGEPYKTWELVAPFPDKQGRITITVMGMYECPKCHKKFRDIVGKFKAGKGKIERVWP